MQIKQRVRYWRGWANSFSLLRVVVFPLLRHQDFARTMALEKIDGGSGNLDLLSPRPSLSSKFAKHPLVVTVLLVLFPWRSEREHPVFSVTAGSIGDSQQISPYQQNLTGYGSIRSTSSPHTLWVFCFRDTGYRPFFELRTHCLHE